MKLEWFKIGLLLAFCFSVGSATRQPSGWTWATSGIMFLLILTLAEKRR